MLRGDVKTKNVINNALILPVKSGSGRFVRSVYITKQIKLSFLTTTGIMTVVFEKDEALDDYFVSAMEFKEGCPINPEDLI